MHRTTHHLPVQSSSIHELRGWWPRGGLVWFAGGVKGAAKLRLAFILEFYAIFMAIYCGCCCCRSSCSRCCCATLLVFQNSNCVIKEIKIKKTRTRTKKNALDVFARWGSRNLSIELEKPIGKHKQNSVGICCLSSLFTHSLLLLFLFRFLLLLLHIIFTVGWLIYSPAFVII